MRVAVYFTPPPDHPLVKTAASWLGRDAFSGEAVRRGPVAGFDEAEVEVLTVGPRRYGLHATLKPPFRIAADHTLDEIRAFLAAFCREWEALTIPALSLTEIGPFFALTAALGDDRIDALASAVVRDFDPFRAPLTESEIARRRPERLTDRQRQNLHAWGYPYVHEDFRFHMTLTGPVPANRRPAMRAVLRERFASFLGRPLTIDTLSLFRGPAPSGDFVVDTTAALASAELPVRAR